MEHRTELSTREASELVAEEGIQLKPDQIAQLAKNGAFPGAHKGGGHTWRIPEESVAAFARRQKRKRVLIRTGSITLLISVIALVATLVSGFKDALDLADVIDHSAPEESVTENIVVDYARLFGAYQVPALLTGEFQHALDDGCFGFPIDFLFGEPAVWEFWGKLGVQVGNSPKNEDLG
jgi:hypothetical protein